MFKKDDESNVLYPPVPPDPLFQKRVFNKEYGAERLGYGTHFTKEELPATATLGNSLLKSTKCIRIKFYYKN